MSGRDDVPDGILPYSGPDLTEDELAAFRTAWEKARNGPNVIVHAGVASAGAAVAPDKE